MDDTGSPQKRLIGHSGPVYGVSFSHDSRFLISCSEDTTGALPRRTRGDRAYSAGRSRHRVSHATVTAVPNTNACTLQPGCGRWRPLATSSCTRATRTRCGRATFRRFRSTLRRPRMTTRRDCGPPSTLRPCASLPAIGPTWMCVRCEAAGEDGKARRSAHAAASPRRVRFHAPPRGWRRSLQSCKFHPNAQYLATGSSDRTGVRSSARADGNVDSS